MKNSPWKLYVLFLCLFTLSLVFLSFRGKRDGTGVPGVEELSVAYYHEKRGDPGTLTTGCSGSECHPKYPHEKAGNYSPFMNMHAIDFSCFVCHSVPGMNIVSETVDERVRLAAAGVESTVDYHERFKKTLSCRNCHSDSGKKMLEEIIERDLTRGFLQPNALKLIEEGSKKWIIPGF